MRSFLTASHWGLEWLEKNCGGKKKQHQRETLAFLDQFFKISRLFKGWMEENKGWCSNWRGNIKHTSAEKGERGEILGFSFEHSLIWAHVARNKNGRRCRSPFSDDLGWTQTLPYCGPALQSNMRIWTTGHFYSTLSIHHLKLFLITISLFHKG